MKRVLILVEGQTEETFVNEVLAPHLTGFETWTRATRICTKSVQGRRAHRGGVGNYEQIRGDLRLLLRSNPDAVTTMMDYYGLPDDFPGKATLPPRGTPFDRVAHLEKAFAEDVADARFVPGLVLHEFEGLLFSTPRVIAEVMEEEAHLKKLEGIVAKCGSPEEINDSPHTHPSKRITDLYPTYRKALHGPQIALQTGLDAIRARCRHFSEWLARIEAL